MFTIKSSNSSPQKDTNKAKLHLTQTYQQCTLPKQCSVVRRGLSRKQTSTASPKSQG